SAPSQAVCGRELGVSRPGKPRFPIGVSQNTFGSRSESSSELRKRGRNEQSLPDGLILKRDRNLPGVRQEAAGFGPGRVSPSQERTDLAVGRARAPCISAIGLNGDLPGFDSGNTRGPGAPNGQVGLPP